VYARGERCGFQTRALAGGFVSAVNKRQQQHMNQPTCGAASLPRENKATLKKNNAVAVGGMEALRVLLLPVTSCPARETDLSAPFASTSKHEKTPYPALLHRVVFARQGTFFDPIARRATAQKGTPRKRVSDVKVA